MDETSVKQSKWKEIYDNLEPLKERLEARIQRYQSVIKKLSLQPTVDTSVEMMTLQARINEIEEIFATIRWERDKYIKEVKNG